MKNPDTPRNTSRRSFMKKSVVAAVAASNLTIFSGLVNAEDESPSKVACHVDTDIREDEQGNILGYLCWFNNPEGDDCDLRKFTCYDVDEEGRYTPKETVCFIHEDELSAQRCSYDPRKNPFIV